MGVRLCCLLMVIAQESTQSLTALYRRLLADIRIMREQQDIALALMIALGMVMFDIFPEGTPQGALTEGNHLGQALLLYRADPTLRKGIQVWTAGRQCERPSR